MDIAAVVATIISSTVLSALVTGIITWRVQTRALGQAKLMETTRLFIELMALGHSRDTSPGRKDPVGKSEMLGALQMMATVGLEFEPLKSPAAAYLNSHARTFGARGFSPDSDVAEVVTAALARLK